MTKTIYHYNPNTNEYLASSEAIRSPLDKDEVYLIPAFATELEPFLEDGKTTIFENGKWINKVAVEPKLELFTEPTLEELKAQKIAQLKNNLINVKEGKTPKKGSLESYEIDGVFRTFKVKLSDLATVVARVSRLEKAAVGTTAQWTDIDGNRLNLNLEQFQCLRNHLDVRDQSFHTLYEAIKSEIKACTTLEELEAIDINFV